MSERAAFGTGQGRLGMEGTVVCDGVQVTSTVLKGADPGQLVLKLHEQPA